MKPLLFFMLVVLLAGCSSANSSGPPSLPQARQEKEDPGWCLTVHQAAFSPDNRFLLIGYWCQNGDTPFADMLPVYDLKTWQIVHTFSRKDLATFQAIAGTARVFAINREGELNVWDITTGKLVRKVREFPKETFLKAVSPDGSRIVIGRVERRQIKDGRGEQREREYVVNEVWDIREGKTIRGWPPNDSNDSLGDPVFSPDGKWLFTEYTDSGKPRREVIWDLGTGKEVPLFAKIEDSNQWLYPLAFSPEGKLAASQGWGNQLYLWDWSTGKIVKKLSFQAKGKLPGYWGYLGTAFSADGKRLLCAKGDLTLRCWEIATGKEIWTADIEEKATRPQFRGIIFSPDGQRAITSFGAWIDHGEHSLRLKVWDCTKGTLLRELPPLPDGSEQ